MEFHDVVPQCRVNLDWGKCFDNAAMERQGVMNIPYGEGEMNLVAKVFGLMVDTITILDDGIRDTQKRIAEARCVAPLAERILIIRREGQGYRVFGKADVVCADRSQRQRQVYVC